MEMGFFAGGVVFGVAAGAWLYRYLLKRNPEAIEQLAAQARALRSRIG